MYIHVGDTFSVFGQVRGVSRVRASVDTPPTTLHLLFALKRALFLQDGSWWQRLCRPVAAGRAPHDRDRVHVRAPGQVTQQRAARLGRHLGQVHQKSVTSAVCVFACVSFGAHAHVNGGHRCVGPFSD